MKRRILVFLLVLLFICPLFAVSIEDIIESAKAHSISYQNTLINYSNGLLNLSTMEKNGGPDVSVSGTINPLVSEKTVLSDNPLVPTKAVSDDGYGIEIKPEGKVVLDNNGRTTITLKGGFSTDYKGKKPTGNLSLSGTHTFDFSPFGDTSTSDIDYAIAKNNTELSFKKSDLSFNKTVISNVSSMLSSEQSLKASLKNLQKQQKRLQDAIAIGEYSEDSQYIISLQNNVTKLENSYDAALRQFESSKNSYKNLTGLDWEEIDEIREPELELVVYENGNTTLLQKSLSTEKSRLNYENVQKMEAPNKLLVSGSVDDSWAKDSYSYGLNLSANYDTKDIDASFSLSGNWSEKSNIYSVSAQAGYTTGGLSVSASPGFSYDSVSNRATPSLTIKGSWKNNTSPSTQSEAALNNLRKAENEYSSALSDYTSNAQSLELRIIKWNYTKAQKEADIAYYELLYENEKALYELGLSNESDIESALDNLLNAQNEYKIILLDGLSLEMDLKIFEL